MNMIQQLKTKPMRIITKQGFRYRRKTACFNFDQTLVQSLVQSTSPHFHSPNMNNLKWLRPIVPTVLHSYYQKGFAIVIFTNNNNNNNNNNVKLQQIQSMLDSIGCPYKAYIAVGQDVCQPQPHMFYAYQRPNFDFIESFYVGNQLGRCGDISSIDKDFAHTSGLRVVSPEQIFHLQRQTLCQNCKPRHPEVVLMVGYPGSGKTVTAETNFGTLDDFVILNEDVLTTDEASKKALHEALHANKSVVIDTTNQNKKTRSLFIHIAQKWNIPVRAIELATSREESQIRNDLCMKQYRIDAYETYTQQYEKPTIQEGLYEIVTFL